MTTLYVTKSTISSKVLGSNFTNITMFPYRKQGFSLDLNMFMKMTQIFGTATVKYLRQNKLLSTHEEKPAEV